MIKSIFEYQSYKAYLAQFILSRPGKGRGIRSQMAQAMNCQRSFVTKVLSKNSGVDFSPEQAIRLNPLLGHTEGEADFFLLLVQFSRAGNQELKSHVLKQIKGTLNRRLQVHKDLESRTLLSPEDHMRYYSAWYYAAIRVMVGIPGLNTEDALARRLNLPAATISSALEFLVSRGLLERSGRSYRHKAGQQIHLSSDHHLVAKHHANWRLRALAAMDQEASKNLHFSYVVTISENDALRIRSYLVDTIREIQKRAGPSKEETVYSICLDYFEL